MGKMGRIVQANRQLVTRFYSDNNVQSIPMPPHPPEEEDAGTSRAAQLNREVAMAHSGRCAASNSRRSGDGGDGGGCGPMVSLWACMNEWILRGFGGGFWLVN